VRNLTLERSKFFLRSEPGFGSVSLRERSYDLTLLLMLTHLLFFVCSTLYSRSIEQSLQLGDEGGRKYPSLFSSPSFTYQ